MLYHTSEALQKALQPYRRDQKSIGFVPTMGALHQGHISLVERAHVDNTIVVVSIFVNPTQFDQADDLKAYPRTLESDTKLLKAVKGIVMVFAPNPSEVYGAQVVAKSYNFGGIESKMEGQFRTGHFDGVGTVLNLLFRAINPQYAYFGEKDFQQLQIVRKLVKIEKLPVKIVGCPIIRESNGLAMSSRNKRLSALQLQEAALINRSLRSVKKKFASMSIAKLKDWVTEEFEQNPHLDLEYFEIARVHDLSTAQRKRQGTKYRAFIAAFAGEVRLIDNMALN